MKNFLLSLLVVASIALPAHARKTTDLLCCIKSNICATQDALPELIASSSILQQEIEVLQEQLDNLDIICTISLTTSGLCEQFENTFTKLIPLEEDINRGFEETCTQILDGFETTSVCLDVIKNALECESHVTPIFQSDIPFVIDQPGTYCIAEPLTGSAGQNVITINATDVILNMNNHRISSGDNGIVITADRAEVFGGSIDDSIIDGMTIGPSDASFIHDINIQGAGQCSLQLLSNASNTVVKHVTSQSNTSIGLSDGGQSNCFVACTAKNNQDQGFFLRGDHGVVLDCVSHNNDTGIELIGSSENNHVRNCTVFNNSTVGIRNDSDTQDNDIFDNIVINNGPTGFENYNNNINAFSATLITHTETITQPGSYVLANDIFAQDGEDGIVIAASDVILDLNNHTIEGGGVGTGIKLLPETSNVVIKNGTIRDFGGAVTNVSIAGTNHAISDISVAGGNVGFNITGTACVLQNCRASGVNEINFTIFGFQNCLNHCTAKDSGFGFFIVGDENIVINSVANMCDTGIALFETSTLNYVFGNTTNNNSVRGIDDLAGNDTTPSPNYVFGNFAANNSIENYDGVPFQVGAIEGVGRLENAGI